MVTVIAMVIFIAMVIVFVIFMVIVVNNEINDGIHILYQYESSIDVYANVDVYV